jgi:thiamine biosynthesis lipoprotein
MRKLFYLFLLILFSCSFSDNIVLVTNSGQIQGTYYHIKYMSDNGEDYHFHIDSLLQEVDSSLSIYKSYSLISRLNRGEELKTDSLFNTVFMASKKVFLESERAFDCSIFPIVNAWGFYEKMFGDSLVVDSAKFRRLLYDIGFNKIQLFGDSLAMPKNMSLDFNAIAQGYTVDLIAQYLENKNITNYLIEVGGEILAKGRNDDGNIWRIGVDKPSEGLDANDRFQFILDLEDKALATSGNYRKFYKLDGVKYSHTINPFTGFPAHNRLLSVTVIYDNCMLADAYATAFMVMGVKQTKQFVLQRPDIEVYLVYTDNDGDWRTYISTKMLERIIN